MTETTPTNRLTAAFEGGGKQLMPFLTAGYPSIAATEALLGDFESRGVKIVELGFPFSDPIADGPTIQASMTDALATGLKVDDIFQAVCRYRDTGGTMALLAMVSYSIVFRVGVEAFLDRAAEAGFDGLIVPDLSLEEAESFEQAAAAHNLCNVMLIAPTSSPERQRRIASHSRGFIYYISVAGVTGERDRLPESTIAGVARLREHVDTPICIGFGVSRPDMVRTVCDVADGAIVGSAIIHRITDNKDKAVQEMVAAVGEFVSQLLEPLR